MKALVVGGSNGVGLSIVLALVSRPNYSYVYVVDRCPFPNEYLHEKIRYYSVDLAQDYTLSSVLDCPLEDIDALYVTAGFGQLDLFQNLSSQHINNSFKVNTIAPIQIIRQFYDRLLSNKSFDCAVMVSVAGRLSSPFFSVYSATKAALSKFIEAINIELEMQGASNRILDVSPGSLHGTSFNGGKSEPNQTQKLAIDIIDRSLNNETLFIPQFDEIFRGVIERYQNDPHQFGIESYIYKQKRK